MIRDFSIRIFTCLLVTVAQQLSAQPMHIDYMFVHERDSKLVIAGAFGQMNHGTVSVDGVQVPIDDWNDTVVTCSIPLNGAGSAGPVLLQSWSGSAGPRLLSVWNIHKSFHHVEGHSISISSEYEVSATIRYDLHSVLLAKKQFVQPELGPSSSLTWSYWAGNQYDPEYGYDVRYVINQSTVPVQDTEGYSRGFMASAVLDPDAPWLNFSFHNITGFEGTVSWVNRSIGPQSKPYYMNLADFDVLFPFDSFFMIRSYDTTTGCTEGYPCTNETVVQVSAQFLPPADLCALQFAPGLIAPNHNDTILANTIRFLWHPVTHSKGYRIQSAGDDLFSTKMTEVFVLDTSADVRASDFAGTRYWRVRSENQQGIGKWSQTRRVVVAHRAVAELFKGSAATLRVTPGGITWRSNTGGSVGLSIYDLLGRCVCERSFRGDGVGSQSIPELRLQPGAYLVAVELDGSIERRTMIIGK